VVFFFFPRNLSDLIDNEIVSNTARPTNIHPNIPLPQDSET